MSAERCCMIIDAHPVIRLGIKRVLEPSWDFEELSDGRGVVDVLNSVGRIEVAIVEMRSSARGVPSGPATIRKMLHTQPGLGVVAYGGRVERHSIGEAMDSGAMAYVSKRSSPTTLQAAVDAAAGGKSFIDPIIDRRGAIQPPLTPRQREVLQFLADGHAPEEVARRLGLSTETVRTHAKASLARLEARDRAHAIAIALRGSLID